MRNDVSFKKLRVFKSKSKLFYEMLFYFVSIALGSVQGVKFCIYFFIRKALSVSDISSVIQSVSLYSSELKGL